MPKAAKDDSRSGARALDPEAVLAVARSLARELHATQAGAITLESLLDRDLGLDSLGRVELIHRLEASFSLRLPEQVLASAETLRDLLEALRAASPRQAEATPAAIGGTAAEEPAPGIAERAQTLPEALLWHARRQPERTHLILYDEDPEREEPISYGALLEGAESLARGLREHGVAPGEMVAIMLPSGREYFHSFLGTWLAGAVPVPIYPPARPSQLEDHLRRHTRILANAGARVLITFAGALGVARLLRSQLEERVRICTAEELERSQGEPAATPVRAEDTALLQYTSGSTGTPKGVVLSHRHLIANIRAMGEVIQAGPGDVFVSWLPLYHDMGLIGAWLGSLYYAIPLVLMSPLAFLSRPLRWLEAIHRHRGTLSGGPNFGYELCLRGSEQAECGALDLSSWRMAFNGAEPIRPQTLSRFVERFGRHGLRPEAIAPVYGLAEATLGLAFTPLGRGAHLDHVARASFLQSGRAVPAAADDASALCFVSCGPPLPGTEVRAVDAMGSEVGEREQGRLEFRSPSATSGYFRNPEATRALFHGEWLDTGDLGYLAAGEVYITGRSKELIIRAGRNLYPYELEEAVGNLPGVRKGCVAVFGSEDPDAQVERLVVVAETRLAPGGEQEGLRARIREVAVEVLGEPPDEIVLAAPQTILKTSSGKLRRADTRARFEQGTLLRAPDPLWRQLLRLARSAALPELRRALRSVSTLAYAAYGWGLLLGLGAMTWILVLVLPGAALRWRVARTAARVLFKLSGTPLRVHGGEHLADRAPLVIAANHASYLDGLVLTAVLPRPVRFVAKRELAGQWVAGPFLRRLGAHFVERFGAQEGAADTARLVTQATDRVPLVFFPEGGFDRSPGLRPFHLGAFAVAAQTTRPVVPIAIRGTRSILRGSSRMPRRGEVEVWFLPPIPASAAARPWEQAVRLRDAVRAAILPYCGEPDLEGRRFDYLDESRELQRERRHPGSGTP